MSEPTIAYHNGAYELFADDAAHPNHWLARTTDGEYYLFPRGEGFGAWYSRKRITADDAAMHLYPVPPAKAEAIAVIAMRRRSEVTE